jgi:hypothetical protein
MKGGVIMPETNRQYVVPFAELVDRLTVDQIKEVLVQDGKESYAEEMRKLCNDIDLIIGEKTLKLNSRLIRIIIVIAQMNLHIWHNKDLMQKDKTHYNELLKLSHQLNGIRNQMKNLLLEETGDREKSAQRSNFNTDGLAGWNVSI